MYMHELTFKGTPQLETERLILRKLNSQDENDIFEYASDDEVTRFLSWDTYKSIEDSRDYINFMLGRYERDEAGEWGIVLKETNKLIGAIGIIYCDMRHRYAGIGYVLSRKYWGQGIMSEG
jgi:ribosomal-protein-alanine N-acetyltransferase